MPFDTPPPVSWQPFMREDDDMLSLRFGPLHVQSSMLKADPNVLVLGYTRAMMAFLLLNPEPRDVLIVGLGGGSLSKYCHQLLPQARITTVEINQRVIALRDRFCIPEDSENFRIIHADAAMYMRHQTNAADVILLDGFDEFGLPEALSTTTFYGYCRRALRDGGVLAANLHNDSLRVFQSKARIGRAFPGGIMETRSVSSENTILFGTKKLPPITYRELEERADRLISRTDLPFARYMRQLWESVRMEK